MLFCYFVFDGLGSLVGFPQHRHQGQWATAAVSGLSEGERPHSTAVIAHLSTWFSCLVKNYQLYHVDCWCPTY